MNQNYTSVKGVSERRRLPRIGVIRLGKKMKKGEREYPVETDYFVLTNAPAVAKVYGEEPKELPIMFPMEDQGVIFPQALKYYGKKAGLKCKGNGEKARYYDEESKQWKERNCPCDRAKASDESKRQCFVHGTLNFFVLGTTYGGVYQLRTSSITSIQDLNSAMDMYRALIGRISNVPLWLIRKETEIQRGGEKRKHYTLMLEFRGDLEAERNKTLGKIADRQYLLPAADDKNPELDPPDEIVEEDDGDVPVEVETKAAPEPSAPEPVEPMTSEQATTLRKMMASNGIDLKDDQNRFFAWVMEKEQAGKTYDFAGRFILNFEKFIKEYIGRDGTKDKPDFLD